MERVVGQVRYREPSHGAIRAAQRKVLGARMKEEESLRALQIQRTGTSCTEWTKEKNK